MPSITGRQAVPVALLVLGAAYLALMLPTLRAPFGDSHDGRNAGVWAAGSRALREDGPIDSVLGARHQDGTVYANHPPALLSATALAETVGGEHPASTRAPALLASLAAIPLLYLLLRALDLSAAAALLGTTAAVATPMFRTFGAMVDTPVLGLPVGIAVLLAWARRRAGTPLPRWAEVLVGGLAALVAWQCVLAVVVVVLARRKGSLPLAAGVAGGLALTLLWIGVASGGLGGLLDVFVTRTGNDEGRTLADAVASQRLWLSDLLGPAGLGVLAALVALADRRHRIAAAVLLATSFGWAVVMTDGAAVHSYWLYWAIVPAAFGVAWTVEVLLTVPSPVLRPAGAVAVGLLAVVGLATTSFEQDSERAGADAGDLVVAADGLADQPGLPLVGVVNPPADWIPYESGIRGEPLTDSEDLRRLADERPDDLVLVTDWCPSGDRGALCRALVRPRAMWDRRYELVPAAELVERLPA